MNNTREINESDRGSQPSSATSRSLLARVQADEPQAWERLVDLYAPLVHLWCRRWRLQEPDVADVFLASRSGWTGTDRRWGRLVPEPGRGARGKVARASPAPRRGGGRAGVVGSGRSLTVAALTL